MVIDIKKNTLAYAKEQDRKDVLHKYRSQFHLPKQANGEPFIYLCGNSLGLQPIVGDGLYFGFLRRLRMFVFNFKQSSKQ